MVEAGVTVGTVLRPLDSPSTPTSSLEVLAYLEAGASTLARLNCLTLVLMVGTMRVMVICCVNQMRLDMKLTN